MRRLDQQPPPVGSPAHAGIDPRRKEPGMAGSRLPRSRGDRPAGVTLALPVVLAPPLTRGSTRHNLPHPLPPIGSPAHAGIDPICTSRWPTARWLPRSRGDRPLPTSQGGADVVAPPLTRGSTRRRYRRRHAPSGSPAHAGIDPYRPRSGTHRRRLPRSRGDRPLFAYRETLMRTAPPLTRGSTRSTDQSEDRLGGSPAHAGIDP